jgi:hypothetical protein
MNRLVHRMTLLAGLASVGLAFIANSVAAAPLQEKRELDPISRSPLTSSRAPASVNPLLDLQAFDAKRPGVSILQAVEAPKPRWRLMGTCRQDIGMQRNQNGIGYGDCRN